MKDVTNMLLTRNVLDQSSDESASLRPAVTVSDECQSDEIEPAETPDSDIFKHFQSIGDNCEFGLVQRKSGIEPLDLMRFAGFRDDASRLIIRLTDSLKRDFAGLGDLENLVCELPGERYPKEYLIYDRKWQLQYHSGCHEHEMSAEHLLPKQVTLLRFKRRELFADMRAAKSIFVWKSNLPAPADAIQDLVTELRRRGPNLLLWVKESDSTHPPGTVEFVRQGLLMGYITKFAPYEAATNLDYPTWRRLCRNALNLANRVRANEGGL